VTETRGARGAAVARVGVQPCIVVFATRSRVREMARRLIPRRRGRVVSVRSAAECLSAIRATLVDAVLVDLAGATEEMWNVAALARDFPSVPFVAVTPLRPSDAPAVARCVALEFCDVLVDSVDEAVVRELLTPLFFSMRFATALAEPPETLSLSTDVHVDVWRMIVAHAGRPVRTAPLARALRVTREHLSRRFSRDGGPNLKRVIDLVRLIVAAELAKNPGYDVRDVARVLGFASSSHLATTARRVVGTKPGALSVLRAVDLVGRFVHGRKRSRT
jgi:AraC-like DNA-binding protein